MSTMEERAANYGLLMRAKEQGLVTRRQVQRCDRGCALVAVYTFQDRIVITTHGYKTFVDDERVKTPSQAWLDERPADVQVGCKHGRFLVAVDERWRVGLPQPS